MRKTSAVLALVASLAMFGFSKEEPVAPSYDWVLRGEVVQSFPIPNSGGAYAVTIVREWPEVGGEEYLVFICDHHLPDVVGVCRDLVMGDDILAQGYVASNEPYSGQRLSARKVYRIFGAEQE